MPEAPKISVELQAALRDIVELCEKEDQEVRDAQIRQWKKHEEFWHGIQYVFWSNQEESWISPQDINWFSRFSEEEVREFGPFYDVIIDIFTGHGQSIIAALSAQIPSIRFVPDDADSTDDLITARTYSRIADVIYRHNKAKLIFMRALFFLWLQGIVFGYRYKDAQEAYGSYKIPEIRDLETTIPIDFCVECEVDVPEPELNADTKYCPSCGSQLEERQETIKAPTEVGEKSMPKTRVRLDIYSGLQVKVPIYARNQAECGYLQLVTDQPKDLMMSLYPEDADAIRGETVDGTDRYPRAAYSQNTLDQSTRNMVTVYKTWLRPYKFWLCENVELREELQRTYPDGIVVTNIGKNKIFVDAEAEKMDDRWEVGQAGLATFIHSDAVCRPLLPVQELRNNIVNLTAATIERGVPAAFADPSVLDFNSAGKFEAIPGVIYPAKAPPSGRLSDGFFVEPRATLSKDIPGVMNYLDKDGQFVVGSFPSIYGGPSEGKSRTFSEYDASRRMALQRLSIIWNFVSDFWYRLLEGATKLYASTVVEDQHFAQKVNGSYINVWIRKSEMSGTVGGVETEGSEQFPVSVLQKRDTVLRLIELNNPLINTALYAPENTKLLQEILSMDGFVIPGEDQRVKQTAELNTLIAGEPLGEQSSVPIEPDLDDDEVHMAVVRAFLVSQIGQDLKTTNPTGYANCLAHMLEHKMNLMVKTQQQGVTPGGIPPPTAEPVRGVR